MPDTTIPVPPRMAALPTDKHGRPVPWFVAWIDGQPDFRVIRPGGIQQALKQRKCWLCGGRMGPNTAFVIGPMCVVNRNTAEPGSHLSCAKYAAVACPFLSNPSMRRRETGKPQDAHNPAGTMIGRNPGACAVWVSRRWSTWSPGRGQILIDIGDPVAVHWFAQGREATRSEVVASIESGLPLLRAEAERSCDRAGALAALEGMHAAALRCLPAEAVADA